MTHRNLALLGACLWAAHRSSPPFWTASRAWPSDRARTRWVDMNCPRPRIGARASSSRRLWSPRMASVGADRAEYTVGVEAVTSAAPTVVCSQGTEGCIAGIAASSVRSQTALRRLRPGRGPCAVPRLQRYKRARLRYQRSCRGEDALGVHGLLDSAHQGDFLRAARQVQEFLFEESDAVFGRDRAAPRAYDSIPPVRFPAWDRVSGHAYGTSGCHRPRDRVQRM